MKELNAESTAGPENPGLNISDILFILFKHKWKIMTISALGLIAAAAVYFLWPRLYVSEAKLLVRYVVDKSAIDPVESAAGSRRENESVIRSEVEILTSWDLAAQVAEAIGPKRLLPQAGNTATVADAARDIVKGLTVLPGKGSNVILVSYKSRDPELSTLVLKGLVENYFKKHLEVHRSTDAFDFVSQQNLLLQGSLRSTEEELKQKKMEANIISLPESIKGLDAELARSATELHSAEAELAQQRAVLKKLEGDVPVPAAGQAGPKAGDAKETTPALQPADNGEVLRYQSLVKSLAQLRELQVALRSRYTAENQLVRLNQAQIDDLEKQRGELETKIPQVAARSQETISSPGHPSDIGTERARLAGIEAKAEVLKSRLKEVEARAARLWALAPRINELDRRRELEEANYRTSAASLEKARVDEALDPSKMPNISIVQRPSPPMLDFGRTMKVIGGLAGGGIGVGIALALLIELLFDRRIKRPIEVETVLGIPLMLSIPKLNGHNPRLLNGRKGPGSSRKSRKDGVPPEPAPWDSGHFIRHYAESIRDRLLLFFQLNGMVHKPKLVAVTGLSGGEGTSTIAGGLASALSETGDGKVLLVDMNPANAGAHPFFRGKPTCSIPEALQASQSAPAAAENLYLATSASSGAGPAHLLPKRFCDMVPNFKASDFDYIIFDMPPLTESSATLAMAGSMDKVLLVVESEKGNRDTMKRACAELIAARAKVSGIFNKTRSYAPDWVHLEHAGSIALPPAPQGTEG